MRKYFFAVNTDGFACFLEMVLLMVLWYSVATFEAEYHYGTACRPSALREATLLGAGMRMERGESERSGERRRRERRRQRKREGEEDLGSEENKGEDV